MSEIVTATVTTNEIPVAFAAAAVDEPLVEPITLQEAKDHLRVVFNDEDDYISMLIVAAREMAEGKLNRTITRRVREQFFDYKHIPSLRKPPFVQLESVSYFNSNEEEIELSVTEFPVDFSQEPAKLWHKTGFFIGDIALRPKQMKVRYLAGYEPGQVPQPIIAWMKLVIGALYQQRESMVVGVSVSMIPEQFNEWLLQPYMVYE